MRPKKEPASKSQQTYFVTFTTAQRTPFFRHERWLQLLLNQMERHQAEFALHDYVVMPDHLHMLLTPVGPLERTVQLIKGGFSFQAKRQLEWKGDIWQTGFSDHQVLDARDAEQHLAYILQNSHSLGEAMRMQRGRHAATSSLLLAPLPPRLKPLASFDMVGGTEVPPFQEEFKNGAAEAAPLQSNIAENAGEQHGL